MYVLNLSGLSLTFEQKYLWWFKNSSDRSIYICIYYQMYLSLNFYFCFSNYSEKKSWCNKRSISRFEIEVFFISAAINQPWAVRRTSLEFHFRQKCFRAFYICPLARSTPPYIYFDISSWSQNHRIPANGNNSAATTSNLWQHAPPDRPWWDASITLKWWSAVKMQHLQSSLASQLSKTSYQQETHQTPCDNIGFTQKCWQVLISTLSKPATRVTWLI